MTHDKTDDIIQRIVDSPDKLTDKEIAEIMHDDYLRSLYDTASLLKSATSATRSYNLDEEWQDMNDRLNGIVQTRAATQKHRWSYAAAIFIGILICGTIGLLFFRDPAVDHASGLTAKSDIDSIQIKAYTLAEQPEIVTVDCVDDADIETGNPVIPVAKKVQVDKLAQTNSDVEATKSADRVLPSIEQALMLTDDDMMIAQMYLAYDYDTVIPDTQGYMTTVNYGANIHDDIGGPTWMSEFMKYAVGLTADNLSVQRGSANMLYRLAHAASDISTSDREAAISAINSLIDHDLCLNDPLSEVLVIGCRDKLK